MHPTLMNYNNNLPVFLDINLVNSVEFGWHLEVGVVSKMYLVTCPVPWEKLED